MTTFSHRERIIKALNHEEPDRVPQDLGGAATANIHLEAYEWLIEHLGFDEATQALSAFDLDYAGPKSGREYLSCQSARLGLFSNRGQKCT